jgi:hypothetical protein
MLVTLFGFDRLTHPSPKCDGRQSEPLGVGQVSLQETTTGICVMDNCACVLDRVRPMASLTLAKSWGTSPPIFPAGTRPGAFEDVDPFSATKEKAAHRRPLKIRMKTPSRPPFTPEPERTLGA